MAQPSELDTSDIAHELRKLVMDEAEADREISTPRGDGLWQATSTSPTLTSSLAQECPPNVLSSIFECLSELDSGPKTYESCSRSHEHDQRPLATLVSCALVCRAWLPWAQQSLYRTIGLSCMPADKQQILLSSVKRKKDLADMVKNLLIEWYHGDILVTEKILQALTKIEGYALFLDLETEPVVSSRLFPTARHSQLDSFHLKAHREGGLSWLLGEEFIVCDPRAFEQLPTSLEYLRLERITMTGVKFYLPKLCFADLTMNSQSMRSVLASLPSNLKRLMWVHSPFSEQNEEISLNLFSSIECLEFNRVVMPLQMLPDGLQYPTWTMLNQRLMMILLTCLHQRSFLPDMKDFPMLSLNPVARDDGSPLTQDKDFYKKLIKGAYRALALRGLPAPSETEVGSRLFLKGDIFREIEAEMKAELKAERNAEPVIEASPSLLQ